MKAKCPKCSYEWNYKGKLWFGTCPRCQSKVRVVDKRKEEVKK